LKKVMLLAAMLAMVLAAAVPAYAQTVTQIGDGNIACVQTAVNQNVVSQGNGNAQANQYGDNIIANSNINAQAIAQECNIEVEQVNTVVNKHLKVDEDGKVVIVKHAVKHVATASATASASAAPVVQYQYDAAAVQYQYVTASAAPAAEAELPATGGSSLIALGAGVLLVAGGLLARRIVR